MADKLLLHKHYAIKMMDHSIFFKDIKKKKLPGKFTKLTSLVMSRMTNDEYNIFVNFI